jgi:diguanylate cyclase (GGDEF)-like protein
MVDSLSSACVLQNTILVVDDNPVKIFALTRQLERAGYTVQTATSGQAALESIKKSFPDLILLDINMPEMNGYEVCQYLKADETSQRIPVIFISEMGEVLDKVKAFEAGGVDYLCMPFHLEELKIRIENQLKVRRIQEQLMQMNLELEERVYLRTIQLQTEIAERKRAQEKLLHMALHDNLTGLPNRAFVIDSLNNSLQAVKDKTIDNFAVLFIDCDQFKVVNDSLGHLVGDQLLVGIAQRLKTCIGSKGLLGRLGGDEFLILLDNIKLGEATECAAMIQRAMQPTFCLGNYEVSISTSIGIVMGKNYTQAENLLRDADTAMYQAKSKGRGLYQVFESGMHTQALDRLHIENDLRRAYERQEFQLYYQPIVCLDSGRLIGLEALLRWKHPDKGMIKPSHFIPVLEDTGLIIPVGEWLLQEACQQMRHWHIRYPSVEPLIMSVNLSVRQFAQVDLLKQVDRILHQSGLDGSYLKLEITESIMMQNPEQAKRILSGLRARRIRLSIDDFGTGYSSMSYLHQYPINTIKIDRSFIQDLGTKSTHRGIVGAIIALAQNLSMDVIAEGIENKLQLDVLRDLGCKYGQGYYFAQPLSERATEHLISNRLVGVLAS